MRSIKAKELLPSGRTKRATFRATMPMLPYMLPSRRTQRATFSRFSNITRSNVHKNIFAFLIPREATFEATQDSAIIVTQHLRRIISLHKQNDHPLAFAIQSLLHTIVPKMEVLILAAKYLVSRGWSSSLNVKKTSWSMSSPASIKVLHLSFRSRL